MEDVNWIDLEIDDNIGDELVYSEEGRESLLENGELSHIESAFMDGYEKAFD